MRLAISEPWLNKQWNRRETVAKTEHGKPYRTWPVWVTFLKRAPCHPKAWSNRIPVCGHLHCGAGIWRARLDRTLYGLCWNHMTSDGATNYRGSPSMVRKWQEAQDILVILALTWYSCEGFVSRLLKKVRKLVSLFITPYSVTDLKDTYEEYVCVQYICLRVPLTHKQLTGFHTHRQFTMETHYFIYFLGTEASQARLPHIFLVI